MGDVTVVEFRNQRPGYRCGYCGGAASKVSQGLPTHMMNCLDYQTLIDRGWRRSGTYCYKPAMKQTCCPQYTIRCRAMEYKLSKSKKKVLNKMRKFLMSEGDEEIDKWRSKFNFTAKCESPSDIETAPAGDKLRATLSSFTDSGSSESAKSMKMEVKREVRKGLGPDPMKPSCRKAKLLRLDRKKQQSSLIARGDSHMITRKDSVNALTSRIPHLNPDLAFKRRLEIRMVRAKVGDEEFEATRKESHSVYQRYQQAIHGDHPPGCSERQWLRFLVKSALNHDPCGPGPGYGNYHQQYVLDGKIIAVGVVDVLPISLSSVYFYYDPDYGFLSLGVYSALSEIAYTQSLHRECDALKYYYAGFYIHSCQKMKYKGEFLPSDLLCPETYEWVPLELCKPVLDQKKYSRLNILNKGSEDAVDPHRGDNFNLDDIGILHMGSLMTYELYKRLKYSSLRNEENEDLTEEERWMADLLKREIDSELVELREYVSLVGDVCAKRMFLYREGH